MSTVIRLENVSKSYNGISLFNNINLEIQKGETVGIIGANGSGKSVLFKIICGFTKPDKGNVYIRKSKLGEDFDFPDNVGILIDKPGYIDIYSGFKNLKLLAGIKNKINDDQIKYTMTKLGLDYTNKTKVKNYSLGMKQKLGIAQAIMEDQDILILDEPFNALDFKSYENIKKLLLDLKTQCKTILLTSHNFKDIETFCDKIYIINDSSLDIANEDVLNNYRSSI